MARISTLTTGTPASTSALVGNVGANTRSFDVEELLGVPITAEGDLLMGDSSNDTTRLAIGTAGYVLQSTGGKPAWEAMADIDGTPDPSTGHITTAGTTNQILKTTDGAAAWVDTTAVLVDVLSAAGDIMTRTTAGVYRLAAPTSGAILQYSTVDGVVGPQWVVLDPGELLTQTSAAVTTALAVAAEGSILEYSTADGSIGPQWLNLTSGGIIYGDANKAATVLAAPGSSGALLITDGSSVPAWLAAGTSGQILETTAGMPTWVANAGGGAGGGTTALMLMAREAHLPTGSTDNLPASIQMHASSGGTIIKPRWVEGVFSTVNIEHLQWSFMCPANYASAPVVDVYFKPVSAIGAGTSVAEFGAYLAAVTPTDADMDIKEFDTVNWANSSVTSSGLLQSVSITMSNADSIAAGDMCILDVCRNGPGSTDTKLGSVEVPMVRLRYTAA